MEELSLQIELLDSVEREALIDNITFWLEFKGVDCKQSLFKGSIVMKQTS